MGPAVAFMINSRFPNLANNVLHDLLIFLSWFPLTTPLKHCASATGNYSQFLSVIFSFTLGLLIFLYPGTVFLFPFCIINPCLSFRPQLRCPFLWAALPDFLSQRSGSLLGHLAPYLPCTLLCLALPGPGCLFPSQDCELPEGRDCVYISIFSFSLWKISDIYQKKERTAHETPYTHHPRAHWFCPIGSVSLPLFYFFPPLLKYCKANHPHPPCISLCFSKKLNE